MRENAGLVEWPVVLMGSIDEQLHGPAGSEVLRSAMSTHQRYFSLLDGRTAGWRPASSWSPIPRLRTAAPLSSPATSGCCVPASPTPASSGTRIGAIRWRDRVCRAGRRRLPRPPRLHEAQKAKRIEALAHLLHAINAGGSSDADPDQAARAGLLCKADLVTEMVGEFPTCRGFMGSYYAEADHARPGRSARPSLSTTRR